jgi:hypothetical protein
MSLRYKDDILPDDPSWTAPTGSYTNRQLENWYNYSRCWPNSIQSCKWITENFSKLLKDNPNYRPKRFSQEEIDRIRKRIT